MALQTPKLAHKPRSLVSGPLHSGPRAICQQCSRVRPAPRMLALTTWATSSTQVDTKAAPSKVTASALKADQVLLRMSVPFRVNFGEVIRVVGSAPEFGSWEVEAAPIFEWTEGDVWVASFAMSPGRHEFKVVVHTLATKSTRWETSANRLLEIPKGPGTLLASCYWGVSNVEYAFEPGRPDFSFLKNMVTYPGDPSARSSAKADSSSSSSSGSSGSNGSSSSKAGSSGNGNGKSPSGHSDTSAKPLASGQESGRSASGQASSSPRSSSGGGGRTATAAKPPAAAAASTDMGSSDTSPKGLFASLKMTSALNSLKAAIGMEAGARSATPSPSRGSDPERHEPAPVDKPHSSAGGKGAAAKGESYPEDARSASRSGEPQQPYNGSSSKASTNGTASTNGKASAGSSSNSSSSKASSKASSSSGASNHHADNGSLSSAKLMKEGLVGLDPDRIQQSVEAALKGKVAPPAAPSTPTPSRAPSPSTAAQTSSAGRSSKAHHDTALTNGKAHASNNGHHHHDWDEDEEGEDDDDDDDEEEEGASAPLTKMPQLPKDLLVAKRPQVLPGATAAAAAAAAAKPGDGAMRAAAARPPSGFKKVVASSAASEAKPADKPLAAKTPDSMGDKPTPQPVALKAVTARRVGTPVPALGSIRASLPEMKEMQRELGDWERSSPPAQPMWQLPPRFVRQPTPAPSRFPSPSPSRSPSRGKTPRPLRAAELLNPEMSKTLGLRNPPRVVQQQYHEIQRSMALEEAGFSPDEIARATGHRDAGMQRAGSGGSSIQAFSDVDEDGARPRLFWATAGAAALLATAGALWMQPPQASKLQAAPSPAKASIPSSKAPASTTPAPALKAAPASTTASPAAASSSSPPPAATASSPTAAGSKAAPAAGLAATPAKQGPGGGEEPGRSDKAKSGGGSTSTPAAAAKAAAPAPAPAAPLPSPESKPSSTASATVDKKAGVTATAAASPAPAVASPSLTSKADSKADGEAVSKADGKAGSAETSSAGKLAAEKQGPGAAAAEKAAADSQAVSAMVSALLPTPSEPSLPQAPATVTASRPAAATAVAAAAASPKAPGGQEGSVATAAGKAAGPGASSTAEQAVEGKAGGAEGGAVKAVEVKAVEVKAAAEAKMQATTQGQQGLSAAGKEDHSPSQVAVSSQGGGSRAQGSSREAAGATAASSPASGNAAGPSPAGPSGPLLASEVAASGLDPGMVQSHEGVDSPHAQARNVAHVA